MAIALTDLLDEKHVILGLRSRKVPNALREIIDLLVNGKEHAVGDMVLRLRIPQPAVSKHLGVLRKVGVVSVSKRGQLRLYRLNAKELKPVYDWVKTYERYWTHQLGQIKQRAELKMARQRIKPEERE